MCENTRQGFWNGSHAPFGYQTEIKERRGTKDKKVLVVDEDEARIVRKAFAMAAGTEGRPVGVKAIASHLTSAASYAVAGASRPAASTAS